MTRNILAVTLAIILSCAAATAQVAVQPGGGVASPLGITSPLGLGPGMPVAPTNIPMGATELATPGISQPPDGTSTGIGAIASPCVLGTGLAGIDATGTAMFDGGGLPAAAGGGCSTAAGNAATNPSASASMPTSMGPASMGPASMGLSATVGRVGIPLGSVELGGGGLSPPPDPTVAISPSVTPAAPSVFASPEAAVPMATTVPSIVCPTMSAPTSGGATTPGSC